MVTPRLLLVASSAVVPAVASLAVTSEQAQFALLVASVIAAVAGGIAWIDKRIERRIREHTDTERREDELRHKAIMSEIGHLRREMRG